MGRAIFNGLSSTHLLLLVFLNAYNIIKKLIKKNFMSYLFCFSQIFLVIIFIGNLIKVTPKIRFQNNQLNIDSCWNRQEEPERLLEFYNIIFI